MKKKKDKKTKILALTNILLPLILFGILLFSDLSENVIYIMVMTIVIGWVIPYTVLLITGIAMYYKKQPKLVLIFNITNILLSIMITFLSLYLFDKKMLIVIIEYAIMAIVSIINVIYYINYLKKHPTNITRKKEYEEIKKIKEKNNGAIV